VATSLRTLVIEVLSHFRTLYKSAAV